MIQTPREFDLSNYWRLKTACTAWQQYNMDWACNFKVGGMISQVKHYHCTLE
uniref:Uncharacterized protein n=1 Tax=Anguilla anguilla TaxID=7936 RepID=A0A0E9WQZ6_ANGAN